MQVAVFIPIVAIIAIAWVIVTAMRLRSSRHGGGDADTARENRRLEAENEALRRSVDKMEQRLAVLERIATDPAERTAREIERLR